MVWYPWFARRNQSTSSCACESANPNLDATITASLKFIITTVRARLVYRIFKGFLKESNSYGFKHCSSVWNGGFMSSFPEESFLLLYVLEEWNNPLLSLVFHSFTKSKTLMLTDATWCRLSRRQRTKHSLINTLRVQMVLSNHVYH
jgi:hypothetical protein